MIHSFYARLLTLLTLSFAVGVVNGYTQYLVSSESLGTRSIAELETILGQPVRTGVSLYKILYMTSDVHGSADTASGLLVFPDLHLTNERPMVIYQHGTTNGPTDAPSRMASGSDEALAYGSMGYITLAADYLGLGDNDGFHPYVHVASEASAALDMLFAVTEWIEVNTGEGWIGDLFIAGYSQGGQGAAAIQKELEENWSLVYPVTASTPMSGPYSLSGVMYEKIISDEIYYTPAYIVYITLSYQEAYGNIYEEIGDIFKPVYVPTIEAFRSHSISTTLMNFALIIELNDGLGNIRPKEMFKDSVLQEILNNENHPLRVALRDNDLFDWTPQAPTRLYYCTADEQVPYQNSLVADSVMQANGASDVVAVNIGPLSHGDCAPLAISESIAFFDSFILQSAAREVSETPEESVLVTPNPSMGEIQLTTQSPDLIEEFSITDMTGKTVLRMPKMPGSIIDVSALPSGVYLIHARQNHHFYQQKIILINQ